LGLGLARTSLRRSGALVLRRSAVVTIRDLTRRQRSAMIGASSGLARRLPTETLQMSIDLNALSADQLRALTAELLTKLEEAQKPRALTMKVSEKGALSIYGLGRFPVTLYRTQWERLFNARQQIADFIKTNGHLLSTKND
jgi:hypothetical protein